MFVLVNSVKALDLLLDPNLFLYLCIYVGLMECHM
jgi:hypothetical protein